jgi:protein disulfide-isomerase
VSCKSEDVNAGSGSDVVWHTNLEKAIEEASTENKSILVNFTGSDWCKWCKKLSSEVFVQQAFIDYAKSNLVLVVIDFPRTIEQSPETINYNRQLAQMYGVRGFPTIVLLDSKGKGIGMTGYQPGGAKNYVEHLKQYFQN